MERIKFHSELHNHNSIGSLLDGMGMPHEIMQRCDELGLKAYAITDHGTEYALYYFAEIQDKFKTKTIYGIELYEAFDHTINDINNKYFHLLALAKNQKGIQALHRLTTMGEFEGKYFKPRIDLKQLQEFKDDLIIGSACLGGKLARTENYESMKQYALEYQAIFGDNFYLELQAHVSKEQIAFNKQLMKLHYETGIPYIITSDSHYILQEDSYDHALFVNVNRNNADIDNTNEIYEECYIHSTDEMYNVLLLSGLTEDEITIGLRNTNIIADICNGKIEFLDPVLPKVQIPSEYKSEEEYFMALIMKGWNDRNIEQQAKEDNRYTIDDYKKRVIYEYNTIKQMDYISYHLIVADFMQFAVNSGIPTAPGRGSAAGSMICYLLKITNINPMQYDLLFERYLNVERISMPDVDSDFSSGRRNEVFEYLQKKYGVDHVAQIINISRYTPLVSIADAGKMLNIPILAVNAIKEFMRDDTIDKSIENSKNNQKLNEYFNTHAELFRLAKKFEGRVKNTSTNACGVVVSSKPIYEYCGMKCGDDGEQLLQVDKKIAEKLGMVKSDVLGTTVLQILDEVMQSIGMNFYDIYTKIPLDDKATYDFLERGLYYGIFQLGSYNMTKFFMELKPKNIEDICLGISAYRPGSMKYIKDIIDRKNGISPIEYDHPMLESILYNTYGIPIYQEQVMAILQKLAGFTFAQADLVRRGMSKKQAEYVFGQRNNFIYGLVKINENGKEIEYTYEFAKQNNIQNYNVIIEGCIHRGVEESISTKIFTDLEDFALYGFNKSHGLAYALLSYYTAYFKCHNPTIFMQIVLTYAKDSTEISQYLTQCKDLGIKVSNPDINNSDLGFGIYNDSILYGIGSLYNVGEPTVAQIIKNRPYMSFEDFVNRNVDSLQEGDFKVDKSAMISLVNSGCFDNLPMKNGYDEIPTRDLILGKVFFNNTDQIKKVSTTNIPEVFDNDLIDKTKFYKEKIVYDLHKELLKKKNILDVIADDNLVIKLKNNYTEESYEEKDGKIIIITNKYKKEYEKHLTLLKDDLKANTDTYAKAINKIRVINKYMEYKGNRDTADLEFESTSFYFGSSWLRTAVDKYGVDEFKELPNIDLELVGWYKKKDLYTIVGVLTGKIKKHKEIILLTNSGIVIAKLGDILYNTIASELSRGDKIALTGFVGDGYFRAEYYENGKSNKLKALNVIN